jgi:hypothetical protein
MFGRRKPLTPAAKFHSAIAALDVAKRFVAEAADELNEERNELQARLEETTKTANRAAVVAENLSKLLGA